MAGDDFAYYLLVIPGCFFFTTNIAPNKEMVNCHSSNYDFNDNIISVGAAMFSGIIEKRFGIKF